MLALNHIDVPVWGRYFVHIFFVLSGASIYVGYASKIASGYPLRAFLAARFARIAPLFYAVLLCQVLYLALTSYPGDIFRETELDASLLFGFGSPNTTLVVGGWSLGIEFVFYLLFPIIVLTIAPRRLVLATLAALTLQMSFLSLSIVGSSMTDENWRGYTNPLAFSFYFISGCYIGNLIQQPAPVLGNIFRFLGIPLFVVLTVYGLVSTNSLHLVGPSGLILSLLVAAIVYGWGLSKIVGSLMTRLADMLGRASYGMYLLHPLVLIALYQKGWSRHVPLWLQLSEVLSVTFVLALIIDWYYERPMRRLVQGWLAPAAEIAKPSLAPDPPVGHDDECR